MHVLLLESETIICKHRKDGRVKQIPVRALYFNNKEFWKNSSSSWDYFVEDGRVQELLELMNTVDEEWLARRLDEQAGEEMPPQKPETAEKPETLKKPESLNGVSDDAPRENFGPRWTEIDSLDNRGQVLLLEESRDRLLSLAEDKEATKETIVKTLAETSRDSALVNRSALLEALRLGDEEARRRTQEIVDKTHEVIDATTSLVNEDILGDELLGTILDKSDGTVVQHMIRVFLNGLSFLMYYNKLVLTSSIVNRIRIDFEKRYKPFYRKLLPHLDSEDRLTLEQVFYGGMQAVAPKDLHNFTSGFLIHDIGKAGDIEYHEGEEGYDRDTVVEHVKMGYKAVMNKTNYPREAGLITGYHHEYYGDPDGYGYFRAFLARYKKENPRARQDYCITYRMEPILDYQALAYFPAKLLEIVDIFDALTDPNRKYKEPLKSTEALLLMRDKFILERLKIDPILFDIFLRYEKDKLSPNRKS